MANKITITISGAAATGKTTLALALQKFLEEQAFTGEISVELDQLEWFISKRSINLSPSYQRGSVWTLAQAEAFMGHLLQGGEILPVIIQRVPDGGPQEVVDGKQRLESMLAWLNGECGARMDDGSLLRISDLVRAPCSTQQDKVCGLMSICIRVKYVNMPWKERVEFYCRLNTAGSPHTPEQIAHARAAKES